MARRLTLRLSDELHERLRQASGSRTMTGFAIEAIAEKLGRSDIAAMAERVADLERRIEQLERQQRSRS